MVRRRRAVVLVGLIADSKRSNECFEMINVLIRWIVAG